MTVDEPVGCLGMLLKFIGVSIQPARLPFRIRDDFLSAAELAFYRVLAKSVGDHAVVLCKVNLGDIFFVSTADEQWQLRNKINRKHVDFLLCHPETIQPLCGVELDDSSHQRPDRQERDRWVQRVFADARLPLVRIPVRRSYDQDQLKELLAPHLEQNHDRGKATSPTKQGVCPKCGVPLVERVARKGSHAGESFLGCPNYPRCQYVEFC